MADDSALAVIPITLGMVALGRKFLDAPTRLPHWNRWLQRLWQPGLLIMGLSLLDFDTVANRLANVFHVGAMGAGLVAGWQLRAWRPARWLALALAPYVVCQVLELLLSLFIAPATFEASNVRQSAEALSFTWLLALLIVARSQKKTLAAEQAIHLAAAQEQRVIEGRNQTLEYEVGQRTADLARQTDELRATLAELQETQGQLVQREKMASLGELTAGIAHEIQNPLNFVNNFADVSAELVAELEEARARPTRDAAEEAELLADLRQNLQRISQHGGRASGIVRGMLAHSRASGGERQPVDVNALCDEYLRLAYHGLRAKDKTFNTTLDTDLAPGLPKVEAVPGDLGRVLLNLLTNAFYAVQKRQLAGEAGYKPTVGVATRGNGGMVEIRVSDNGGGIPDAIKAKIFQPFFTTKPTGEGTGLGLSLSYDIISKGHGGTLSVESEPGQGTSFTICLPA